MVFIGWVSFKMPMECPPLETLAAYADGALRDSSSTETRTAVEAHLADCEVCRATLALSLRLEESDEADEIMSSPKRALDSNPVRLHPANF